MKKAKPIKKKAQDLGAYDPKKIEKKWQKKWSSTKLFKSKENGKKDKFYVLDMFPYPSGEGLHVGHPKGYIATDVISRFKRMNGFSVLHPMGFDAFGLPAENYALKTKTNPADSVSKNVKRYKEQLELMGFDYDWSREVNTTDPAYYKWTQWIFLQLFKKGLAFQSYEPINWCPSCKTGLANEDIEDGRCERCGTPVEKKPLRQWVLRITDYADRLLSDLDAVDTTDSPHIIDKKWPPRPGKKVVERRTIHALVRDPKTGKYLGLKWKKFPWITFIVGGVEDGEDIVEAARREVMEETGYSDLKFVQVLGGPVKAEYFAAHKDQNRVAITSGILFELASEKRNEVTEYEKEAHETIWMDPKDMTPEIMTCAELPVWLERLENPAKYNMPTKPLLEWPSSIKELQRNWIGKSEGALINFSIKTKTKRNYVLLHGWNSSSEKNFFPWLKNELEKKGFAVQCPNLPDPADPIVAKQVEYVLANCKFDENTVLFGHSMGATVAMKVAEKLNIKIDSLVLAGGFIENRFTDGTKLDKVTHDWKYDFEKIKQNVRGVKYLRDIKDDVIPFDQGEKIKERLGGIIIDFQAAKEHMRGEIEPMILKSLVREIEVYTTRPDTLFGVTYVVLSPESKLLDELKDSIENRKEVDLYISLAGKKTESERTDDLKEKSGIELKGIKAVNPANGEEVPVWISDYVLADYGTGAVMAVPAHDERDYDFAKKYGLNIKHVVLPYLENKKFPLRPGVAIVERDHVDCILKDPKTGKFAALKWNEKFGWTTLVGGGIEKGEKAEEAGMKEIREETGYKNVRFIEEVGRCQGGGFAAHKNENRKSNIVGLYFELVNDEKEEVSDAEKAKHELVWVEKDKMAAFLNVESSQYLWNLFLNENKSYTGDGILIDSGDYEGHESFSAKKQITSFVGGKWVSKYKLRDWVFSRQRYWGEPIPVIHCKEHGAVPVPEKELPIMLPKVKSYEPTGTGESPLAAIDKWVNTKCPICKKPAKRETNTMPQWAGSCWYYLRYMDPLNKKKLVDPKKEKYWSPVDLYVGGAEHATRHLIYARFWHKFLYDIGVVGTSEPFKKLQHVGLIMGEDGRKMSKRFGNVVNPDDIVATYGADTLRVYEMFMGPFDQQIAWSTASMVGSRRFIEKVWRIRNKVALKPSLELNSFDKLVHKTVKKVTEDIKELKFNTAISTLMISVNEADSLDSVSRSSYEMLLKLLAPFAPHFTDELWASLGNKNSIHVSSWPKYDEAVIQDEEVKIVVQVNGKVRGSFASKKDTPNSELEKIAFSMPEVKKWTDGVQIVKTIVVPNRIINIVVRT